MPKISVGVLTYNRRDAVRKAIQSVYDQALPDVEVVVVDSASEDGTDEMVRSLFPQVKYIRLPRNLGCPGGRNHIYANCTGEYIVNLDDDGWLSSSSLRKIEEALDRNPDVGILALRQVFADESEESGGADREDIGLFRGGLSVFRRSMLEKIGYYPEEFFLYAEESHMAIRAMSAGYRILSTPDITMWHPRIGGSGAFGSRWNYYRARNEMLVIVDLYPLSMVPTQLLLRALAHGRWALVHRTFWSYLRAIGYVVAALPSRIRHRTPCSVESIMRFRRSRPP